MLSSYVANGTPVSLNCTIQTFSIRWDLPSGSEISFGGPDAEGDIKMADGFTATYVVQGPPAISSLNFTLTPSLNGTTVTCIDNGVLGGGPDSCLILVLRKNLFMFTDCLFLSSSSPNSIKSIH